MIGELTSCTVTTASKVPSLRNDKRAEWKKCTALYGRVGFSFLGLREIGRGIVLRSFEVCKFEPFLEWLFCSHAKVFGVGVRRIKWKTLRIRGHIWHNLPAMQETDCGDAGENILSHLFSTWFEAPAKAVRNGYYQLQGGHTIFNGTVAGDGCVKARWLDMYDFWALVQQLSVETPMSHWTVQSSKSWFGFGMSNDESWDNPAQLSFRFSRSLAGIFNSHCAWPPHQVPQQAVVTAGILKLRLGLNFE